MVNKQQPPKNITIVGASLGGLIAAAQLNADGHKVRILEGGKQVGGLYSKIETPFGQQELGMHVIYADNTQLGFLQDMFSAETMGLLEGDAVDVGANVNFDQLNFNSHYPNVIDHPLGSQILDEVLNSGGSESGGLNGASELARRFGPTAATNIVQPILEKLWNGPADQLTPDSIHCFFDLRRIVVCSKSQADTLKNDPRLDDIVANPLQQAPKSTPYNGRIGVTFKDGITDLSERVVDWAQRHEIELNFNSPLEIENHKLVIAGSPIQQDCDAAIVAVPLPSLIRTPELNLDQVELSLFYFQLDSPIGSKFPAYYLLCHDSKFLSSRIVNYDAYRSSSEAGNKSVLAVEVIHSVGAKPEIEKIADEIREILPDISIYQSYELERSLKLPTPSLRNQKILDNWTSKLKSNFSGKPLFFTGMRTDKGIFFSHHTIGQAHAAALECNSRSY